SPPVADRRLWASPRRSSSTCNVHGTCPQSSHVEIIEARQTEFTDQGGGPYSMCVTCDKRWLLPGQNPRHGRGPLYLYVCRRCRFFQWYARSPQSIRISVGHRTGLSKAGHPGQRLCRRENEGSAFIVTFKPGKEMVKPVRCLAKVPGPDGEVVGKHF